MQSVSNQVLTSHGRFRAWLIEVPALKLLLVFTLLDLLAIALYGLHTHGLLRSRFFDLSRDRGLAENLSYIKYGFVIFMISVWKNIRREPVLRAWLIFFSVLFVDDSIGLHEGFGEVFLAALPLKLYFGAHAKDFSELLGAVFTDGIALAYVGYCFLKAPRDLKFDSVIVALALAPLILVGVILDFLPFYNAEQIGEMLGATLLLGVIHLKFKSVVALEMRPAAESSDAIMLRRAA